MALPPMYAVKTGSFLNKGKVYHIFNRVFLCFLMISLCGCSMPWVKGTRKANNNPCVVLALPASGNYAPVSAKIKQGAVEAQRSLAASGINLRLENINTEEPDWLKKLAALPEMCAVVGGPMQDKKYLAAQKAGLLQKKAFFSFLPNLKAGEEGRVAWRFFPSPKDQIEALVRFASDDAGIQTFGALYPNDNYGRRMTEMLEKDLAAKKITLRKASYTPGSPASVSAALKTLINPFYVPGNKTPIPQTDFEAIFLPDTWKNMDMITNTLIINGEDRLALLGTTLWESALSGKTPTSANKYELAVFPAVWNKKNSPKQLQGAGNDFWTALGYDFVNFAVKSGLDTRPTAAEVTRSAQSAAGAIKGMAPINWNNNGIASQRLYLFQVTPSGIRPVDVASYKQKRASLVQNAALRIQNIKDTPIEPAVDENPVTDLPEPISSDLTEPVISTPVMERPAPARMQIPEPTPAEQGSAPAVSGQKVPGTMSPVPVPSYKLRLPTKR